MALYPLKFAPIFKYRIWGGEKLKNSLNKKYTEDCIGESWEISNVPNDVSIVSNGSLQGTSLTNLMNDFKEDFLGSKVYKNFGTDFPLLIKFIDAKTDLSIQVHPNDEIAKERKNSFGKNEMWYVMEADQESELIVGFKNEENKDSYQTAVKNNTILDILNNVKVSKGDVFYIPAGRIHAIGAGVMIAEIQQSSDITYRIYDYDRVDAKTGEKRELHTEEALDVIDYEVLDTYTSSYETLEDTSNKMVDSPYFTTNIINLQNSLDLNYSNKDSFVILMCVEGNSTIHFEGSTYEMNLGETILLPAVIDNISINGNAKILEVYL